MRDSAEMLKEQLRNQGKEMQRREAEQAKNEAKIKHILKVSQEKIEDLQHEVKNKEHEIETVIEAPKRYILLIHFFLRVCQVSFPVVMLSVCVNRMNPRH